MADPEIPEAAIRAGAEVWFTHWRDEVAGGDAHGMTAAHFEREVREVLAAALPHLTPSPTAKRHARCPWCGQVCHVEPDGRFPIHVKSGGGRCVGSRRQVTEDGHA